MSSGQDVDIALMNSLQPSSLEEDLNLQHSRQVVLGGIRKVTN